MRWGKPIFAVQTYRQEVEDRFNQLDEANKRLVIRGDVKQWNQLLAEAARDAGVITNGELVEFQNAGYMGLYGSLTVDDIHKRKGLKVREKILDFMGSEVLIANLFRISQIQSKLKRENIEGMPAVRDAHYIVGRSSSAIKRVGGVMSENLPTPDKSISEIEHEQLNKLKKCKKSLMLDE